MDMMEPAHLLVDLETTRPVDELADVDVCASNAGVVDILAPAYTISRAKWDRDVAINLTGAFARPRHACAGCASGATAGSWPCRASPRAAAHRARCLLASKAGPLGMARQASPNEYVLAWQITVNLIRPRPRLNLRRRGRC